MKNNTSQMELFRGKAGRLEREKAKGNKYFFGYEHSYPASTFEN